MYKHLDSHRIQLIIRCQQPIARPSDSSPQAEQLGRVSGLTGVVTNPPTPGADNAEPVILIPVGFPDLERGRHNKNIQVQMLTDGYHQATLEKNQDMGQKNVATTTTTTTTLIIP